jgi:membrane protease YdiL (CAAX protease family)
VFFSLMDALVGGEYWHSDQVYTANGLATGMVWDIAECAILLYIVFRSAEPWARFGLVKPRWLLDTASGSGLFVLNYVLAGYVVSALFQADEPRAPIPDYEGLQIPLVVVTTLASVFSQELLFRGYLISRIERAMGSPGWAVFLSAVLFAAMHAYQGWAGVAGSAVTAVVFGFLFAVGGRLWPLVVAHAAHNLVALLLT